MSAIVELSGKPCHFCGKTGPNYKTKSKSQDLQAVLCDAHLKEVLSKDESAAGKDASTAGSHRSPTST